jgi:ATP-dependent DNA helicase DinG
MAELAARDVLGPGGLIAGLMSAYESRPQQLDMAEVVTEALAGNQHAIVEAPTGVGKSFAYLVPMVLHALRTHEKVVISTNTIALQEQLIDKDIPLLQRIFPELKAVLVKGRQNYLSLRRLAYAANGQQALFDSREDDSVLRELVEWSRTTEIGDRADLGYDPPPRVWRQVQSDRSNCLGRKCPTYDECFFYKARQAMADAHILVVNHHLYFSDLSLRDEHAAILPAHQVVVFDEAHTLEDVATDHLGASISEAQVRFYLDGLWSAKHRGLMADESYAFARTLVEGARAMSEEFWKRVALLAIDTRQDTVPLTAPGMVENLLSPALDELARGLELCRSKTTEENAIQELRAQGDRAAVMSGAVRQVIEQQMQEHVYYAHLPSGRGTPSLSASPLSVAELLKQRLFESMRTVVLTSATLAADDSDRFLFLRRRLGIEGGLARRLDSPFDFQTQAKLLLNSSPIDPNSPRYEHALSAWLSDYLATAQGGVFVLFTSYRQLTAVHDLVRPTLDRAHRFVLRHGDGMGRAQMLELFKRVGNGVLFGTSSFWEGVDVPGDALRHVIITKLPFEVPNHPVVEARHADIKRRGGNPFMERTVPEAIIRLKQGFGRLIRSRLDTGTVVISDHRVLTAAYGRYFLRALPPCATELFQLEHYLAKVAEG